jgi:hypothetical protein
MKFEECKVGDRVLIDGLSTGTSVALIPPGNVLVFRDDHVTIYANGSLKVTECATTTVMAENLVRYNPDSLLEVIAEALLQSAWCGRNSEEREAFREITRPKRLEHAEIALEAIKNYKQQETNKCLSENTFFAATKRHGW